MLLTESLLGSASGPAVNYIEDVFSTYLYTGTGSAQTITNGIDLSGKGGLVWIKDRTAANANVLFDTERGANKRLISSSTLAQSTETQAVTSFNSDGFSIGTSGVLNTSDNTLVSWTFRKQAKFFDVVTYTGNNTDARTIAHNLGSTPGCIIVKKINAAADWMVWHRSLGTSGGAYYNLRLNTTDASVLDNMLRGANSTTFTVSNDTEVNGTSSNTYVAYLFAHDAGGFGAAGTDNVISCGSFTTDGSENATVNLGYEPQWVMIKSTDIAENWEISDVMRGVTVINSSGTTDRILLANATSAEAGVRRVALNSTGFSYTNNGTNQTFIYIAIRRSPMKTPTSGTSVFALTAYDDGTSGAALAGSGNSWVNSRPDLAVFANRAGITKNFQFADLLRGYQQTTGPAADTLTTPSIWTPASSAESAATNAIYILPNNGSNPPEVRFSSNGSGAKVGYIFRRAPGFFDVVCYTGTGSATTFSHNLGVAPEMMIFKRRNAIANWRVYHSSQPATDLGTLNTNIYFQTDTNVLNSTAPTASVFTVGTNAQTNASGATYVAYLFATVAGVSKVGSYTGSGTTKQIDCGFTNGARFVLIKRVDDNGDWYVWDSARGIVAGNDPYLLLNSTNSEVTNTDYIDTYSAGFEISSTAPAAINASGGTFIFLAIA